MQEVCGALVVEHVRERQDRRVDPIVLLHLCISDSVRLISSLECSV